MFNLKNLVGEYPDLSQVLFYALMMCSLWCVEKMVGSISLQTKLRHSAKNAFFIFTALPLQLLMTAGIIYIMQFDQRRHWGASSLLPFNGWLKYIVLFLLLDLGEYVYHIFMHKVHFLWRFHLVHHSDVHLDVSTTVREHPVETVVRTGFLGLWVFLFGPNLIVLMLRQAFQTVFNIFAHTEFRLPEKWNRVVSLLFITPNLHHVHHHFELPYTDQNYGDVLSIWDRIFRTYGSLPASKTTYGIDVLPDSGKRSKTRELMLHPFRDAFQKRH